MKYIMGAISLFNFVGLQAQQKLIKVNYSENSPEEVSIAINPVNPMQVVASSNINNYYYSVDGGITWKEKQMESMNGIWGDPMVHFDSKGNLYFAHLGKNPRKSFPNWIDKMVVQKINVRYDTCFYDIGIGYHEGRVQDKEWLNTDLNGNVFISWTEFDKYKSKNPNDHSRIRFSQSKNQGATWSESLTVSDVSGDCLDGDSTMEGATSCADSKGNIYVCWSGMNNLWLDKSIDGGVSFGTDKVIARQVNGWDIPVKHIFRANGMPFMLCNNRNSKFKDRIYVNWADTRNGDADVFIKYSDDGGENWSEDQRVNNDPLGNGADQFSNNLSIDASSGNVYILFYDKRNSNTGAYLDVYLASSDDGGSTWKNSRITPKPFAAPGSTVFFGDYIDIDAVEGKIIPVFTANENTNFVVYAAPFVALSSTNRPLMEGVQAVILNDSLYIHFVFPEKKKFVLTISFNGTKKVITGLGNGEQEFVMNARGFREAKITLKNGFRKKKLTVLNQPTN